MADDKEKTPAEEQPKKKYRKRKERIPIDELLAYGSEESRGKEQTLGQKVAGPLVLAVLFFLSFLAFLYAPHHLSRNKELKLPKSGSEILKNVKDAMGKHVPFGGNAAPPTEKELLEPAEEKKIPEFEQNEF